MPTSKHTTGNVTNGGQRHAENNKPEERVYGETITQNKVDKEACPIRALARRIHHILSNGGTDENLLSDYWDGSQWKTIESKDIVAAVRAACTALKLEEKGFDPDLIGAHSLRAGGAMAMKLHGEDAITIKKIGRWTSLTFTQYIHNQIAHLNKDVSKKMSIPLPFLNVAVISRN